MRKRFSIAQARDQLAQLIRHVEHGEPVELTRRGKPVAVLLSTMEFDKMRDGKTTFWEAYSAWRKEVNVAALKLGPDDFKYIRDR